jgi:acetyl esterase/lipase
MDLTGFVFLAGLLFSSAITSCNKGNSTEATKDTAVAALQIKNVSYGSDTAQTMDIYLPANRDTGRTNVVLFIHGGGWGNGDKNDFNEAIAAIGPKLPGYAIFNMNYRLANKNSRLSAQLHDVADALAFIESKTNEYQVNAEKVGLVGASAGAHLALLQAYKFNSDRKIKAVVDLFGPADLTDMYHHHPIPQQSKFVLVNLLGETPATDPEAYRQASPVHFVTALSAPTIIFHGTDDIVVPITQSNALKAALQAHAVKVEMTVYTAEGHGWYGKNLQDTYAKTIEFIKQNVF